MGALAPLNHYPAFLDLRGRLVVVVGNGSPAEKRARALIRCGADVVVISDEPTQSLLEAEALGKLTVEQRTFSSGDLAGVNLVICIHEDPEVRRLVESDATTHGCLLSVAGEPDMSNFSIPTVLRRGGLQIAVSTGGLAPQLARRVRARLSEEFGEEWATYVTLFGELRQLMAERLPGGPETHGPVLEALADSDALDRLRDGQAITAEDLFAEFASAPDNPVSEEPS